MFFRTGWTGSTFSRGRSTRYSDRLHDFSATIFRCYRDVSVNSFFPGTAKLWNCVPVECFRLTYDLNGFQCRINRHVCFNPFALRFLVTPCFVVAVQPCMKWIPIKKRCTTCSCRVFILPADSNLSSGKIKPYLV